MKKLKLFIVLILLIGISAFAGKKEKYEVWQMPSALYLTNPQASSAYLEFSEQSCPKLKPKSHSAYGYLEIITQAGERRSGSQAVRCAQKALKELLKSWSYDVKEIKYRFPYYHLDGHTHQLKDISSGKVYPSFPVMYSMSTSKDGVIKGKVDLPWKIDAGEIVYVRGGLVGIRKLGEKVKRWKEKGAIGFIVSSKPAFLYLSGLPVPVFVHKTTWHYGALPGLVVQNARKLVGKDVSLKNLSEIYAGAGYNIVAKPKGNFKDYVLVSAHLDSWYQGALDDGSGVAVLMRMAELVKDKKWDKTGVIFLICDGEELGLIGSSVFFQQVNPQKIKAMIELDMVSSKDNIFHKDPKKAPVLPRLISSTAQLRALAKDVYKELPGKKIYTSLEFWRKIYGIIPTDIEWFYCAGVPGIFIYTPSRYYHTVKDSIEWIDPADIEKVAVLSTKLLERVVNSEIPRSNSEIEIEFNSYRQSDGTVAFAVRISKDGKIGIKAKPKVYCYYEHGFEKEVKLKSGEGGWYRGSFAPFYQGEYQFLAYVKKSGEVKKQFITMQIENPVDKEKYLKKIEERKGRKKR